MAMACAVAGSSVAAKTWEEAEGELHALAAAEGTRIDPAVSDLVVALRLLGFPTIGSCEGHLEPDEEGEKREPYVGIRFRLARRFIFGAGPSGLSPLWLSPRDASKRERSYLAALAWKVNRPAVLQLREYLDEFCSETSRGTTFLCVRGSWRGVWIESAPVDDEQTLAAVHAELRGFGQFLRWLLS